MLARAPASNTPKISRTPSPSRSMLPMTVPGANDEPWSAVRLTRPPPPASTWRTHRSAAASMNAVTASAAPSPSRSSPATVLEKLAPAGGGSSAHVFGPLGVGVGALVAVGSGGSVGSTVGVASAVGVAPAVAPGVPDWRRGRCRSRCRRPRWAVALGCAVSLPEPCGSPSPHEDATRLIARIAAVNGRGEPGWERGGHGCPFSGWRGPLWSERPIPGRRAGY